MGSASLSYEGYRYPVEVISHCVWLYHRFPLSFREVEELMLERGIVVSYETVRRWCGKFGQTYANALRRRQPQTRISLYDLVDEALTGADPLAREHGVRLVGNRIEPLAVEVDGKEMSRVLGNLLVNAIRRTPADGTVAVAVERSPEGVLLSVTDGCGGIPEEDLPRVFDTGWRGTHARTPPAGAGLGLAIVRGIIEAHRGSAAVRNIPGGCRFEVTLPTAAPST